MAEKFRNKYRVQTTRLFGYDYTRNGAYFITICTKKFTPYFGEIKKGNMTQSETGLLMIFGLKFHTIFQMPSSMNLL